MKVLLQGRLRLMEIGGGDKVQIMNTAAELKKLGVDVDLSFELDADYSRYDIIHVFQLDWTPETYLYAKKAKKLGKPLVLSPIHHSIEEVKKFDDNYVFGIRRIAKILLSDQHQRDTLKNINRALTDPLKRFPTLLSMFMGLKNMHTKTLNLADYVLVQTNFEAKDLEETYGVKLKWSKVPNGVGEQFIQGDYDETFFNEVQREHALSEDYIICVGRIEPRKNQLSIIEAVAKLRELGKTNADLLFVGTQSSKNHLEYVLRFRAALRKYPWVKFVGYVPYIKMPVMFKHAKVCVSASWFESTGLTSIEALFCGTNAVAAGIPAHECLGDLVTYCEPQDVASISNAVEIELSKNRPNAPGEFLADYTWTNAAKKTLAVYNEILKSE